MRKSSTNLLGSTAVKPKKNSTITGTGAQTRPQAGPGLLGSHPCCQRCTSPSDFCWSLLLVFPVSLFCVLLTEHLLWATNTWGGWHVKQLVRCHRRWESNVVHALFRKLTIIFFTFTFFLQQITFPLIMCVGAAVIGSLQFGYNSGVINVPQTVRYTFASSPYLTDYDDLL